MLGNSIFYLLEADYSWRAADSKSLGTWFDDVPRGHPNRAPIAWNVVHWLKQYCERTIPEFSQQGRLLAADVMIPVAVVVVVVVVVVLSSSSSWSSSWWWWWWWRRRRRWCYCCRYCCCCCCCCYCCQFCTPLLLLL